ncbi:cytochrome C [uncultured Maribacter sp.]|uniref:cytochrome C n=1 Tax=uncultured Maribacter sp. TaxID=431308 RepID=UPI00261386B9|nr:cytochrome C [uncultured Maribacter sp.]
MKKRLGIIFLFALLFGAFITIWNKSYHQGLEEAYIPIKKDNIINELPSESKVFTRSKHALNYAEMPVDAKYQRSLITYYNNRAYPGAPPSIPHEILQDGIVGGNSCLKCHENGGFVIKYNAYTPVTPHPEMTNCRQCHVESRTKTLFKGNSFYKKTPPKVGINNALLGSPPMIPHALQMRENCLSCHAGSSAPKEIRVSHPERVNCRQCHVPKDKEIKDLDLFTRAN